ncbi:hypothetical protein BGZ63DRAFT_419324 [Mariannaea sp. PMI_226]|nr:hypothetical protein BGZ63DRAFT_419324 [Mariannaea sp. PMI_226]
MASIPIGHRLTISNMSTEWSTTSATALAHAYLASPEVVAASALSSKLSGPGIYKTPENFNSIEFCYGTGLPASPLSLIALSNN